MTANPNTSVTIRARELDDNVIKILLPSYENIAKDVEKFRETAKLERENRNNSDNKSNNGKSDFENKNFYNIISILGERGSGKTSVLLTEMKRLKENNENEDRVSKDIFLPIIIPEKMSSQNDALGWIIGFLKDVVEKLKKKNECICSKNSEDSISKKYESLCKSYFMRKPEFREAKLKDYPGLKEYVEDSNNIIQSDLKLMENFRNLIDEIISKSRSRKEEEPEPLLFIFFDDVDISAEKCPDILKTIMTFLTHPNIVVFVSGDYKVFQEVITIDFLKNERILDKDIFQIDFTSNCHESYNYKLDQSALSARRLRSIDYLRKIMPPSYRYEIDKFGSSQKREIYYSDKYKIPIFEMFLKALRVNPADIPDNYKADIERFSINPTEYMCFFGDNIRCWVNLYTYLYKMAESYKDNSEKAPTFDLSQFLELLINSNIFIADNKKIVKSLITINNKYLDNKKPLIEIKTSILKKNFTITEFDNNPKINEISTLLNITKLALMFINIGITLDSQNNSYHAQKTKTLNTAVDYLNNNKKIFFSFDKNLLAYELVFISFANKLTANILMQDYKNIFNNNTSEDYSNNLFSSYFPAFISAIEEQYIYKDNIFSTDEVINVLSNIHYCDSEWVKNIVNSIIKYPRYINKDFRELDNRWFIALKIIDKEKYINDLLIKNSPNFNPITYFFSNYEETSTILRECDQTKTFLLDLQKNGNLYIKRHEIENQLKFIESNIDSTNKEIFILRRKIKNSNIRHQNVNATQSTLEKLKKLKYTAEQFLEKNGKLFNDFIKRNEIEHINCLSNNKLIEENVLFSFTPEIYFKSQKISNPDLDKFFTEKYIGYLKTTKPLKINEIQTETPKHTYKIIEQYFTYQEASSFIDTTNQIELLETHLKSYEALKDAQDYKKKLRLQADDCIKELNCLNEYDLKQIRNDLNISNFTSENLDSFVNKNLFINSLLALEDIAKNNHEKNILNEIKQKATKNISNYLDLVFKKANLDDYFSKELSVTIIDSSNVKNALKRTLLKTATPPHMIKNAIFKFNGNEYIIHIPVDKIGFKELNPICTEINNELINDTNLSKYIAKHFIYDMINSLIFELKKHNEKSLIRNNNPIIYDTYISNEIKLIKTAIDTYIITCYRLNDFDKNQNDQKIENIQNAFINRALFNTNFGFNNMLTQTIKAYK